MEIDHFLAFIPANYINKYQNVNFSVQECQKDEIMTSPASSAINRSFLLGLYNHFQIEVLKQSMSIIFYIDNGFAAMAAFEPTQGYYQNIGGFYPSGIYEYPSSAYPQTWTKTQLVTQSDAFTPQINQSPIEDSALVQQKRKPRAQKSKRKIEKTLEKQILSAKKNSQSNIINQFYSFFSNRQKSERIVHKCAILMGKTLEQADNILPVFYNAVRFINAKRGRKYVNASMLLKFFNDEEFEDYLGEMKEKMSHLDFLSIKQLCQILRRCAKYFLKEVSINAILTSKRISVVSKEEHLKKRRKVMKIVMDN